MVFLCRSHGNTYRKVFRGILVGYVRVSTTDGRQSTDLQRDALRAAGVDERHIHEDRASGSRADRPALKTCMEYLRAGDVLVVWKLDRLGRSLPHLMDMVSELQKRGIGFRSLTGRPEYGADRIWLLQLTERRHPGVN